MRKSYFYWTVIAVFLLIGVMLPSSKSQAAVVFTNIATVDNSCSGGLDFAVVFDVPVGQDYQVNSVDVRIQSATANTLNMAIYADNAGTLGPQVVALGPLALPAALGTFTLTPNGADILANGGRYWMVVPNGPANWCGNFPRVAPTGVFTFVDNGFVIGGNLTPQNIGMKLSIDADPYVAPTPPTTVSAPVPACSATDSRVNSICDEPWQTAAVYCSADGSIDVYGITDSIGWLAFRATLSEIDAIGIPDENAIIAQTANGRFRLYRLSSGEFQINAPMRDAMRGNLPNGYSFRFDGCP